MTLRRGRHRIVHALAWYFPEALGGTEVYVDGLCQRLRDAGHSPSVVAPKPGLEGVLRYEHRGIPVLRYPIPAAPTRAEARHRSIARGAEHLHEYLRAERPDVVHFHTFSTGLGLAEIRAARAAGARVVATNHLASLGFVCQRGTLMRWGESLCDGICRTLTCSACELTRRGLPRAAAWAVAGASAILGPVAEPIPGAVGSALSMASLIRHNRRLQAQILGEVDRFVVLNRWALEALVANGADRAKLELNYLGASHTGLRKPSPAERPTSRPVHVGYLGRLVEIKGVLDLARAATSLPNDVPLRLEFRGPTNDPESADVARRLREICASDTRVSFAPPVPPEDVPAILAAFDVLCVPSTWFENGPTVMSEAHSVGTPVVGTRLGAMPEVIRDGVDGRLFEPGDWRGLAGILADMAHDPRGTVDAWRERLPRARTMDEICADYLRTYAEVLAGRVTTSGSPT